MKLIAVTVGYDSPNSYLCSMCQEYWLEPLHYDEYKSLFGIEPVLIDDLLTGEMKAFGNVSTVLFDADQGLAVRNMHWNLIPAESPSFDTGRTWYNATVESLQKPYQKELLKAKRCVLPISGFYEPRQKEGCTVFHKFKDKGGITRKRAEKHSFTPANAGLLFLGGLYDIWQSERYSCAVITLPPNAVVGAVHERMPFVLSGENAQAWLNPEEDDEELLIKLIRPIADDLLVSRRVWPKHLPDQLSLLS